MSLRLKFLLSVVLLFISTTGVYLFYQQRWIDRQFDRVNEEVSTSNGKKLHHTIEDIFQGLESTTHDWASWDEMYDFVQNKNFEVFIEKNLKDSSLRSAGIQMIMVMTPDGDVLFEKYLDENNKNARFPEALRQYLYEHSQWKIFQEPGKLKKRQGFIPLSPQLFAVVARDIVNSDESLEPRGILLMGLEMTELKMARLSEESQNDISFYSFNEGGRNRYSEEVVASLEKSEDHFMTLKLEDRIQSLTPAKNMTGDIIGWFEVTVPRRIEALRLEVTHQRWEFYGIMALLIILITAVFFEWYVMSRIRKIARELFEIYRHQDLKRKIAFGKRSRFSDEIGCIIKTFNDILELHEKNSVEKTFIFRKYQKMMVNTTLGDNGLWTVGEAPPETNGTTRKVLIVDDEDNIREFIAKIMIQNGYTVETATNGQEALWLVKERGEGISLIIMDEIMPMMDGVQAYKEIRKVLPLVKILFTSGYNASEAVEAMRHSVMVDFIQKPFHAEELLQHIHQWKSQKVA